MRFMYASVVRPGRPIAMVTESVRSHETRPEDKSREGHTDI